MDTNEKLISRLSGWRFTDAKDLLVSGDDDYVCLTVRALSETFGNVGYALDGTHLSEIIGYCVSSLIGQLRGGKP